MDKHRRSLSLSDTRAVLATTGDLVVGAYARRIRRKRIGIALVGVLLIASAGGTYYALQAPADRTHSGSYRVIVRCSKCNKDRQVDMQPGQTFPLLCPTCKERACHQLWQCRKCGKRFVPEA